ncbi:ThuA domain-containing protein [Catenulispora rubra]|uniref:ThuA domain-containing protein n=1 Tax=Catenulispora rubra TaxID=280293 RepID=UPI00189245F0|nr:ThuA domain-containing protein [Catenulispora rubra]
MTNKALIVRGGWEGHSPTAATELFLPVLAGAGFDVTVASPTAYGDPALAENDLIVQCYTGGMLSAAESAGLCATVAAGSGFAGWHGGVLASFDDRDYQRMVGGVFLHHPAELTTYTVTFDGRYADHPVVADSADFTVTTEQYWILTDAANQTLATTVCHTPDGTPVSMPVIWTRQWGHGRVFVNSLGHSLDDLRHRPTADLTERGLLWAARR